MTNAPGVMLGVGLSVLALGALIRQYGVPAAKWFREKGDSLEREIVAWKTLQSEANGRLRSVESQFEGMVKGLESRIDKLADAIRGGK